MFDQCGTIVGVEMLMEDMAVKEFIKDKKGGFRQQNEEKL